MKNDNKLRLLYLSKILYERTDEDNMLTGNELMQILETEYGISSHRQTIPSDIEALKLFGMDIEVIRSINNYYHVVSREFDTAEVKLLMDAVSSSKFISEKKSKELISKLSSLSSEEKAKELERFIEVEGRIKSNNEKLFLIVDAINKAISENKKISFEYFHYGSGAKKQISNDGKEYIFSPYMLVWNGDYYYMLGWSDKHQDVTTFRIDRIKSVPKILEEKAHAMPKGFNLNKHINTMFHMYSSSRERVSLLCDNKTMDAIVDKFGEKVKPVQKNKENFSVTVEVAVNHVFYSWVFGFGGLVKITAPEKVKNEYKEMVMKAAK